MPMVSLCLLMTAALGAHDPPHLCPDCAAELCRARAFVALDCAQLGPALEANYQALSQYSLRRYQGRYIYPQAPPASQSAPAAPAPSPPGAGAASPFRPDEPRRARGSEGATDQESQLPRPDLPTPGRPAPAGPPERPGR